MDFRHQNTRRYVVTLDKDRSVKLHRLDSSLNDTPAGLLYWLIWHWLQADGIVTFGSSDTRPQPTHQPQKGA